MRPPFLTPRELAEVLALPVPFGEQLLSLPIADVQPDPGLFGPGSVTWKVLREPLLILAGARALLMQAAHPGVAQGAIDHSAYAEDPFGRLFRTFTWAGSVAFGTTAEARAAAAEVNRLHRRVRGAIPSPNGTRRVRAGAGYTATDPNLLLWVHATFVDTLLVAHERMAGGLTPAEQDLFVREWDAVGTLMGVPRRLLWPDRSALSAYVEDQLEHGPAQPGEGSRLVARTVMHPPLPSPLLRPLMDATTFMSVGFLPAGLRRRYGITWTPAHELAHNSVVLTLRTTRKGLPRRLRVAPIYDFAMARSAGRLLEATRRSAA